MIRDPLLEQIARNMYRCYLLSYYKEFEDLIDSEEPMSFEEYVQDCELFKEIIE